MSCAICQKRRPRRFCPGVRGDICATCCGSEREVTVSCPLDCPHLRESRLYEKVPPIDPAQIPNADVRLPDDFLDQHGNLMAFLGLGIVNAALQIPGAVDRDAREALDALVRTYQTLEKGIYYDSRPGNPLAAALFDAAKAAAAEFQRREREALGLARTRDVDVLNALVFLQRVELDRNNGRPRGRAFLDLLRESSPGDGGDAPVEPSGLVLP